MVRVSYQAQEQVKRLSPEERRDLRRILEGGDRPGETTRMKEPGTFVSRFGENRRVVWEKADDAVIVRTVVSM